MRLSGLSSGLDTEAMVKEMMKPHQSKVDKAKQDKVLVEYKQEVYREIMTDMKALYTKYFDIGSSANQSTNLLMSSNYETVKFVSTNDSVVTAKGLAGAKGGSYSVTVEQMATASKLSLNMNDLKGDSLELNFGGEKIEISLKDKDGNDLKDNKAIIDNINTAIAEHNKNPDNKKIDVKVSYSELGESIIIEGKSTGDKNELNLSADIVEGGASKKNISGSKATNAIVNITDSSGNSKRIDNLQNNSFTIDNVQYTINGVSEKIGPDFEKTKLSGRADSSKAIEIIRNFVIDYNNLIDKVNKSLGEKKDSSYKPLTEDQKKEMSEDEIKLWNGKVKQGLLRSDDILTGAMNELLDHFSTKMGGGLNLEAIGITLNSDYRTQKGKITLDEGKLADALNENGEETRKLLNDTFNKVKDTFNETAVSSTSKLAKRAGYEGSVTSFNNELTKKMDDQQKRIDKMLKDLKKKEEAYYNQFTRLEVAMNKANSQMSYFTQQMG